MKLQGVYIRNHPFVGDLSVSFKDPEGDIPWVTGVVGGNGTGKSLLVEAVTSAFAGAVRENGALNRIKADLVRVDFTDGRTVWPVQSRQDKFERQSSFSNLVDLGSRPVKHCLLSYGWQRVQMSDSDGGSGVRSTVCVLSDLHTKGIEDSVVLMDDFDCWLDKTNRVALYRHLRGHLRPKRNQLVIFCREKLDGLDNWIDIGDGVNVVDMAMKG